MLSNRNQTALIVVFSLLAAGTADAVPVADAASPKAAIVNADEAAKAEALQVKAALYQQEAKDARQAAAAYAQAATVVQAPGVTSPGTISATPANDKSGGTASTTSSDASTTPAPLSARAAARGLWIAKMKVRYTKLADIADQLAAAALEEAAFHQQRAAGIQPE